MDTWKIKKLVDALETSGVIKSEVHEKEVVEIIEKFFEGTIHIEWCVEDVLRRAKDTDIDISEEQARKVLDAVKRYHDCETGVNWDVIDYHISVYTKKRG